MMMMYPNNPGSIREVDRIRWFHRLALFGGGVTATLWSAYWLRWAFSHDFLAVNTTLLPIFGVIVGPTLAILSLLPVKHYFGTIQIVRWPSDGQQQQQACQGCQSVGSLELFQQRILFRNKWDRHLLHCQVCGYVGLPNQNINESVDEEEYAVLRTAASEDITDPVLKANAILQSAKPKREQLRAHYEEVPSDEILVLVEFLHSTDHSSMAMVERPWEVPPPPPTTSCRFFEKDEFYQSVQMIPIM